MKEIKESEEVIIKNNNEIDLPKIINSEVNLLVFPFFALNRKNLNKKLMIFLIMFSQITNLLVF